VKITPREKGETRCGERKMRFSPRRVSPFLAWGDFHACSRFAPSTIPEEKWGTTRSLKNKRMPIYWAKTRARQDYRRRDLKSPLRNSCYIGSDIVRDLWPERRKWQKMKWVRVIIQGSEIKDFCLKQGQCLQASEVGTPLLKLHLTAPPPPRSCPPSHPRSKRYKEIRYREDIISGYS